MVTIENTGEGAHRSSWLIWSWQMKRSQEYINRLHDGIREFSFRLDLGEIQRVEKVVLANQIRFPKIYEP
jgi:hypothetical protein